MSCQTIINEFKKMLQELSEEFLLNLVDRLDFEIEIRAVVYSQSENNPWLQPMYLIPMWNIVEKIKAFEPYFHKLNINFPKYDIYRQPIDLSTVFPDAITRIKEEELIFNGEIIRIKYKYI